MLRSVRVLATVLSTALAVTVLGSGSAGAARPDGLEVTGWILESGSNQLVHRNAGGLSTLSVAAVSITAAGDRVAAPSAGARRLLAAARRNGLAAELLVSNYSNAKGDFDPAAAHRLLSDPEHVEAVAGRLAGFVADQGWDGVNVDLERIRRGDADGLTAFVQALQDRLPAERTVSIDLSAATSVRGYRQRGYSLAGLAGAADTIALMTYDYSGPTWSGPGPIGPLRWQRRSLKAALDVVPADRLLLGVAGYGYSWPRHRTGRSLTIKQVRTMVRRDGATPHWRAGAGEWSARLSTGTVLWWSDRRSYRQRIALARKHDIRGLAVWRVGSADTLR